MKEKFKNDITDLLPNRDKTITDTFIDVSHEELIDEYSGKEQTKLNAKEIAKAKYKEQSQLNRIEAKVNNPASLLTSTQRQHHNEEQKRIEIKKKNIELLDSIDVSKPNMNVPEQVLPLIGATRPEIAKLLQSLNINVNVNLTKNDTYNLLSCLLTCNENQLRALQLNPKIPITIKAIIVRLLKDASDGNIGVIESLWDRIFGKQTQTTLDLPTSSTQTIGGIIPNTVVSREAYVIIRDTLIGKE